MTRLNHQRIMAIAQLMHRSLVTKRNVFRDAYETAAQEYIVAALVDGSRVIFALLKEGSVIIGRLSGLIALADTSGMQGAFLLHDDNTIGCFAYHPLK